MISLVALDMAGTTIDEGGAVYEALHAAVAEHPINVGSEVTAADVQQWMGAEKRTAMRELTRLASGAVASDAVVEEMYEQFRDQLRATYAATPPVPVSGTNELFTELRTRGIRVALTTGFSRDIAEPLVRSLGWQPGPDSPIDAVVCGDEVAAGRPAPYMIFRAMEQTGIETVDRVLVAGDTVVDLRAGMNAGVRMVIGVATGKLTFAELGAEPHTHLLASVADIPTVLDA
ncbi:phosphonatase-like hydrolase [Ilumatobacter nonamiensis]|uniref:phosphonatase-like hydrolase n=1 Tax=Ilumatobacter nonamiensis TaxID=467093 RepID=UPI000348CEDB|nr:phosphonatase-like hydrolase [Ilumatobacter nonamiensis]